jgi:thioredoxin reductase
MYNIAIIGAGAAGLAAGLSAAKSKTKTLVVAKGFSTYGQSDNLGLPDYESLKKLFLQELKRNVKFLEFLPSQEVLSLEKNVVSFSLELKSGQIYYAQSVIICSGRDEKTGEGNTGFDLLAYKDSKGLIKTDSAAVTNISGLYAAGSVVAGFPDSQLAAMGEGAKAAQNAIAWLKFLK